MIYYQPYLLSQVWLMKRSLVVCHLPVLKSNFISMLNEINKHSSFSNLSKVFVKSIGIFLDKSSIILTKKLFENYDKFIFLNNRRKLINLDITSGISKNDFNQTLFLVIAVATILSGILGLHVKIVADSIAHGMVASGFSELSKYIGQEGKINSKNIDRNSDEVPRISPKEWQDSNGVMWKKHEGLLYYWNGEQWDVHQQLTVVEEPNWDNYFERFCSKAITKFESSSDEITIQKLHSIINMYNYENTDRTNSITDFFSKSVFSINKILLLAPNEFYAKFQEHKYYPKYEKIFSDPMKLTIKQKQAFFVLANQLLEMIEW